jgi:hypothetical protein
MPEATENIPFSRNEKPGHRAAQMVNEFHNMPHRMANDVITARGPAISKEVT